MQGLAEASAEVVADGLHAVAQAQHLVARQAGGLRDLRVGLHHLPHPGGEAGHGLADVAERIGVLVELYQAVSEPGGDICAWKTKYRQTWVTTQNTE